MERYWIGIDTGGTFTDLVLRNVSSGKWFYYKVPTWTADPAKGILDGIAELLAKAEVSTSAIDYVVLGTTKATNAVLEGAWARTGMITTQGFADVLDLARQRRPDYFNLDLPKPTPPAKRADRYEVAERVAADGKELVGLDEAAVVDAIGRMKASGVDTVAVCFMHAYANPAHEQRALALVREHWPKAYVCASSGVLPEFREYERFVTTAVNASLMPVMDVYLARFEAGVRDLGISKPARVMQSNGGAVSASTVRKLPVNTFFSGPAGGVMAAIEIGRQTGLANLIGFDMGGTSTDVCLIKNGRPSMKHERSMAGMPVRTPSLDIHTIGAGGGSIAWIDQGGLLKVGPKSAGAYPGPAAYGRGGEEPTVTDANVVLGRLNPVSLLGGRMQVFADQASAAIESKVGKALDYDRVQSAVGVIEIANVHMTGAVRVITIEQGEDPRDYALVAFGGAGPLHAAEVALAAGIRHIVVPPRPGVLSAQGLLQAPQRADFGQTCLVTLQPQNVRAINHAFGELHARVEGWREDEKIAKATPTQCEWIVEMRYVGQSSDLAIGIDTPEFSEQSVVQLQGRFNARHKEMFGYELAGRDIEVSSVRVTAWVQQPPVANAVETATAEGDALLGHRKVWFAGAGYVETPVLDRDHLRAGQDFEGPAIIEQMDTTTVVPPKAKARTDALGYLHITLADTNMAGVDK